LRGGHGILEGANHCTRHHSIKRRDWLTCSDSGSSVCARVQLGRGTEAEGQRGRRVDRRQKVFVSQWMTEAMMSRQFRAAPGQCHCSQLPWPKPHSTMQWKGWI
jgi:hypothetical protein